MFCRLSVAVQTFRTLTHKDHQNVAIATLASASGQVKTLENKKRKLGTINTIEKEVNYALDARRKWNG
jgi:hypothetical protein